MWSQPPQGFCCVPSPLMPSAPCGELPGGGGRPGAGWGAETAGSPELCACTQKLPCRAPVEAQTLTE